MKETTATALRMTDAELQATRARLMREIPAADALLDAIRREMRRRKRGARLVRRPNGVSE